MGAGFLAAAGAVAVANWWSRWRNDRWLEWITKPLVTLLFIMAALVIEPVDPTQRAWFVTGLALCLAGDVFLMLPNEQFAAGLASFLLGHVAFIAGFLVRGGGAGDFRLFALIVVVVLTVGVGARVVPAVRQAEPVLLWPVVAYIAVIMAMVLVAGWKGGAWGVAGAISFAVSDSILAWNKFVARHRWMPVVTMITYHAALAGLVLSLS